EDSHFLYLVTKEYSPSHERCIRWNDPIIGIEWPLNEGIVVSEKDGKCPYIEEAETNFSY
ncbi:MAG: dTDP-4-dehydrorhamnose 3,5-epimerase family protein, partial [Fervidicoccaceae archaeon]